VELPDDGQVTRTVVDARVVEGDGRQRALIDTCEEVASVENRAWMAHWSKTPTTSSQLGCAENYPLFGNRALRGLGLLEKVEAALGLVDRARREMNNALLLESVSDGSEHIEGLLNRGHSACVTP
jgi:hypothetical protein